MNEIFKWFGRSVEKRLILKSSKHLFHLPLIKRPHILHSYKDLKQNNHIIILYKLTEFCDLILFNDMLQTANIYRYFR